MPRATHLRVALIMAAMLVFLGGVSVSGAARGPVIDRAGGARERIEVSLQTDGVPLAGGLAALSFEAKPLMDAPVLEIRWVVPEGAELLGGEAVEKLEAVAAGQTVRSERQIRFPAEGTHRVEVQGIYQPVPSAQFQANSVLFFTIGEHLSTASDNDPGARSPMHTIMPSQITTSSPRVASPGAVSGHCFTVQGNIVRIDQPATPSGYAPSVTVPVRFAVVEIREEDIVFDDSYGEVLTNGNGDFSKSFCDDDGWFDDELEIYVRLVAQLYSGGTLVAEVMDISWIDEVYEYDSQVKTSESGILTFNLGLNVSQSAVFNIADAVYDAWSFWNASGGENGGDSVFYDEGEVHWEPGYGESVSHYTPGVRAEMYIADGPGDADAWDDSVIIHEWGHMADDYYSCDDNPGGPHNVGQLLDDPELAWGEGYPDYYQSAARGGRGDAFASWYLDIGGPIVNLETWNLNSAANISVRDELSIAAALWDLNDGANDDPASFGHAAIQSVYTSDEFEYEGDVFDDDCTFATFARAWVDTGQPSDANAAVAISQNTGFTLPPPSSSLAQRVQSVASNGLPEEPIDYKWWNQLTTVVDNSQSMASPMEKFNAVKTVLTEMVNDLGAEPEGTEFALHTFNNTSNGQAVFAGQFFSEDVLPLISNLSPTGAGDATCEVNALRALANAVEKEYGVDAWLFTDGDTNLSPAVGTITQLLHDRKVRASFALLGLCPPPATSMGTAAEGLTAEEEQAYRMLRGAARSYLGLAAEETPSGVVPYLLTAIASGGQFLYVDESQLADAADVLQAQMTHSAGAGRWSDYVSDTPTYEWDKLATWEYSWIDARSGGTNHGTPGDPYYSVYVEFPADRYGQGMKYYDQGPYSAVRAHKHGYLTFGRQPVGVAPANTQLPNLALPNNAMYPFWDDLTDLVPCLSAAAPDAPQCQIPTTIYSKQAGDWFAIEYFMFPADGGKDTVTFEVLLNRSTDEIRFQYLDLLPAPIGTSSATIGLENGTGSSGIEVGYNTAAKAASGMGYKFLPMPPQPAKTYTVTVDSMMGGLGFLLTGYSGSFEDLVVRYPNGTQVSCADTENVLCLNLGLVQYVQADVDGRTGEWTATVDAGPTGSGTFSFTSFSVSALSVESVGDHTLSTGVASPLLVNLGQPVDGNHLTAWFRHPDDSTFGVPFALYDDGAHGDGPAGDGLFGSDPHTPPCAGTGYLWVQGKQSGVDFVRSDPVPYVFQPISVTALGDGADYGEGAILQFEVQNNDAHAHCYWVYMQAPEGWSTSAPAPWFCAGPGVIHTLNVTVRMSSASPNTLPSGSTGVVSFAIVEWEEAIMVDSASARVTRRRPPATILIDNRTGYLRPNGDTARLGFLVGDEQGVPVEDGTPVTLTFSMGTISPTVGSTHNGYFEAVLTSGAVPGTALVTATTTNSVTASTAVEIRTPGPSQIALAVSRDTLPSDGESTTELVATVRDDWRTSMANQTVRIGVEGDGQMGTINGGEVVTGTTNTRGQLSATFTSGSWGGEVGVRAELLVLDGGQYRPVLDDRRVILLQMGPVKRYLPMIGSDSS